MQSALINFAVASVLAFLFGMVAWVRPDDRARCWFAGWLSLLGASITQLGILWATGWEKAVLAGTRVDLIAVAGIFFVISAAIPVSGRRFGIRLWIGLAIPTIVCLTLATANVQNRWLMLFAVTARQAPLIVSSSTMWRVRRRFGQALTSICAISTGFIFFFVLRGQTQLVVPVILTEMYSIAGIDLWNRKMGRTVGMRVSATGLLLCALVFPLAEIAHRAWLPIEAHSEMWNLPKAVVAVGMILMVFEEEVIAARALGRDYRLLFDDSPHPMWILELESLRFLAVNETACELHGYTNEEFLGLKLPDVLHPDVRENAMRQARMPEPPPSRASRHLRKDGSDFPMDITSRQVVFQGMPCVLVSGFDVTKRERLERELDYQSYHDSLTGLANRRAFEEKLTDAADRAVQSGEKLALLCLDIYHFKRLNEVYGARVGDKCVQYVASVLKGHKRPLDFLARTGDDEFAMVLSERRELSFTEETSGFLSEHFRAPISIDGHEIQVSISMGLAVCPDDAADAILLWRLAQNALRSAQAKGGGQTIWQSPELRAEAEKTLEIVASMNRMLEEGWFHLVYQPLYANDGTVRGMEALLRLNHPRYGPISPLTIVRMAEENGIIESLGEWVFERVCRQIRAWMDEGVRLVPVAVNISSLQLRRRGFAERLAEILEGYGVNSQWIHLEITETAAMENLKAVSGEMTVLSALGCRFSIDDFGTGHSSLGRLHQLPISILKIDRSFVSNLCRSGAVGGDTSLRIVEAILSMAHALGMQVVAEGVETARQLSCLRGLECDFYQGFLLSRPVQPDQIPKLLTEVNPEFRAAVKEEFELRESHGMEEGRFCTETNRSF